MKKNAVLFMLLVCPIVCIGQRDTSNIQGRLKQIESSLLRKNEVLVKRNDSLEREQRYYKAKEEFFYTALSDQTSRFSLVVGGIIAVATGLTFVGYANMLKQVRETRAYVDERERQITVRSDNALKALQKESEKIDFDRLEWIYHFCSSLSTNLAKADFPGVATNPVNVFLDNYFKCGLSMLHLEATLRLHISPLATEKYSTQEVIYKINACTSHLNQLKGMLKEMIVAAKPSVQNRWLFETHNISVDLIDKMIPELKTRDLLPSLYKLRALIEEIKKPIT